MNTRSVAADAIHARRCAKWLGCSLSDNELGLAASITISTLFSINTMAYQGVSVQYEVYEQCLTS